LTFETWRLKPEFEFSLNFWFGNKTEIIKEKGKGKTHLGPNSRVPRPSLLHVRARQPDIPSCVDAWAGSASDSLARFHSLSRCSVGSASQPLLPVPDSRATGRWAPYARSLVLNRTWTRRAKQKPHGSCAVAASPWMSLPELLGNRFFSLRYINKHLTPPSHRFNARPQQESKHRERLEVRNVPPRQPSGAPPPWARKGFDCDCGHGGHLCIVNCSSEQNLRRDPLLTVV
jgi:hypothetical protein